MLDENEKVIVNRPLTKKQAKEFISNYLTDHQGDFEETMEELRYGNPKRWAELYVEMTKMVVPKQTDVNVNVGIHKDFRELHALATTKTDSGRLEKLEPIEDVDFEEIYESK